VTRRRLRDAQACRRSRDVALGEERVEREHEVEVQAGQLVMNTSHVLDEYHLLDS
jgi:hypothetical protein